MSELKLKPCPFCGSGAHIEERKMVRVWFEVRCDECDAGTGIWKTPDEAIKAWNVRNSHTVTEATELKPCPFCGSRFVEKATLTKGGKARAFITCTHTGCRAKTGAYRSIKEATAAWNRRA